MAYVESNFNKQAVSKKGACGVMQIIPTTASIYNVSRAELFDEDINIQVGLHYMKKMLKIFGKQDLALAAYNCGPTRITKAGYKIPGIRETRDYVRKVNDAKQKYSYQKTCKF